MAQVWGKPIIFPSNTTGLKFIFIITCGFYENVPKENSVWKLNLSNKISVVCCFAQYFFSNQTITKSMSKWLITLPTKKCFYGTFRHFYFSSLSTFHRTSSHFVCLKIIPNYGLHKLLQVLWTIGKMNPIC